MKLIDTPAQNELETAFVTCREGAMSIEEMLDLLMGSKLYIPSTQRCKNNGLDLIPLIFDREGTPMASVFSSEERMNNYNNYIVSFFLVSFKEIILKCSDEYGLVINPGYTVGLEIQAFGLNNIRKNFL